MNNIIYILNKKKNTKKSYQLIFWTTATCLDPHIGLFILLSKSIFIISKYCQFLERRDKYVT